MDVLEKLQQTLRNLNQVALARIRPGDMLQIEHERSRLREWVKGSGQLEDIPLHTIEDTLRSYRQNKYLKGLREIRMACYGCTQQLGGETLIENRECFNKLLEYVKHYSDRRRTFRKLYRALLGSYFSYDPDTPGIALSGRENWEVLRQFLARHLASFPITEFTPDWLIVLSRYPDLVGVNPGQSLDTAILQGDWAVFNEIRDQLELDSGSWLVRRLVMAPVMAVGGMDDATFKDQLNSLLLLLNEYPLFGSEGLKILLDRYAACADKRVHGRLRDFAIALWGNPWLPDNAHKWQCGADARALLAHWLKRQLLSEFFGVISNDDKAAPRRLNFWDLYSEDMKGMYFALGRDAYAVGNMAAYTFRSHAKGLIAKLSEEKHGVHTCIMQFGHHHVVEFNHQNNVAYFYDISQGTPSFYFAKGWVEIGAISVQSITQGVDVGRTSKPIRHQDGHLLTWEGKFAQAMGMSENAIRMFCRKYQCLYEDLRNPDGYQWIRPIRHDQYGREVWSVLQGWGFSYSNEEKGYFHLTYPTLKD